MSDAPPHVSEKKMLQAISNPAFFLTEEEMQHLLDCAECLNVLGDLPSD